MAMRGNRGLGSSEKEQQMVPAHEMEQIQEPDRRNLQLCFESRLPESFFTGKKVEGQLGELIPVKLIDRSTGHVVASGPLSSLKLDVVVLPGDFRNEDDDVRTWENFKSHVVKERKGKGPLLAGDLQVSLKEGVGYLGELKFTDNSSWTQSRKFKLGVKVASGFYEGIRVREAITDAFKVKDRRGISYKKHDQPALNDDVWRLKNIAKKGAFYEKLKNAGILKVKDCVWKLGTDPQGLRKILGSSMSDRMWETLVEHVKTCDRSGKDYVYYADSTKNSAVFFKNVFELSGIIEGGEYYSAENLSDGQKVFADTLKKEAYAKWKDVIEYDGLLPLEMNPSRRAGSSQTKVVAPESCLSDTDQRVFPAILVDVAPEPGLVNPGPAVGAFVPHPPSTDMVPSSQPSMRQAIRDYPDSFHPQTSFQPFRVPSGQNSVNYYPDSFHPQTSFQPFRVPSGQNSVNYYPDSFHPQTSFQPFSVPSGQNSVNCPVPCQTPSVPSGEASENSMSGFEESIARFLQDKNIGDCTSQFQQDLSEKADGNTSLDALWREVDRSDSHLPGPSLDPQAGGNTVLSVGGDLSVGAHGGHFEGGGDFFWPRGGGGYPTRTRGPKRRSIFYEVTKVNLELPCPSLGSNVKMEGGNTSSPLFEREEFREMPSLDSKFEGLSVAGPVV